MGKNKLQRFRENQTFRCMIQPEFEEIFNRDHNLKGSWRKDFFRNDNPIVLELGCGRGEYTVGLAQAHPDMNFIGVDIKGARMWRGAKTATEEGMENVAFLRSRIEFITSFFGKDEIDQIWITFPDPQMNKKRVKKRLTAPEFLRLYATFLKPEGILHLKTDSIHLHRYTKAVLSENEITPLVACEDIYGPGGIADPKLEIKTAYESRFLQEGLPISYLQWQLGDRTTFAAPVFPPDDLLTGEYKPVR